MRKFYIIASIVGLWLSGFCLGMGFEGFASKDIRGNTLIRDGFTIVDDKGRIVDKFDDIPFYRTYTTTTP